MFPFVFYNTFLKELNFFSLFLGKSIVNVSAGNTDILPLKLKGILDFICHRKKRDKVATGVGVILIYLQQIFRVIVS